MAYKNKHVKGEWPRTLYYSNPNVIEPKSKNPTGTELANNAKVLMMTRFKLSQLGNERSATCYGGRMLLVAMDDNAPIRLTKKEEEESNRDLDDNALNRLINDEEDEDEVEESNHDEE